MNTRTRKALWVAHVEEHGAHEGTTRASAIDDAITQWVDDVDGDYDGDGPDSITVTILRDVLLCVPESGEDECVCGGAHGEDGVWGVVSWYASEDIEIPITYAEDGYPTAHTDGGACVPDPT